MHERAPSVGHSGSLEEGAVAPSEAASFRVRNAQATHRQLSLRQRVLRRAEQALVLAAKAAFPLHRKLGSVRPGPRVQPKWAPAPLIRKAERSFPKLGWPRETDSLCPECVKETRRAILSGETPLTELVDGNPGEVKAQILEETGRIVMRKTCAVHGDFEDVMSVSPEFLARIERLFPGRDYLAPKTKLRNHGTSSIKYGRGSVLTVDLTNRCNMMCDPCFMDANQVGYVHELTWDEVTKILDDSLSIQPRRQMSVQFSGGEPTLSPFFIDAVHYAREVGYFCVQCASNGIRFAQEPEFCRAAKEAGLRLVYLQFDGVSNAAHEHRKVGNLFDVKQAAIDNLHAAGIDVVLVVTVVRGVNDAEVGPIVEFALENAEKITVVSFQPVSFTGRDEDISDERRHAQRYTLSHLAQDLSDQLGATQPLRDWFPLSAMNPFSDVVDVLLGPDTDFGALKCGCHPNCGIGTVLLVNKRTKAWAPLCDFIDVEQVLKDLQEVADAGRGKAHVMSGVALSLARNFRPERAPAGYGLTELVRQCVSQAGATGDAVGTTEGDAQGFEWRFLFVAGMWFQDLFNYDFRRTEMCIIPYGTQQGEISFCAYNTGVGWRQIIEQMHMSAKVADWYREHGRHPVYAKGQHLELPGVAPKASGRRRRLNLVD
ncbi:MAG: radical SAM protein [Polyangiaceae bacterium]|nr:radical SAM protein [Myxococcales bacterium]MCB9585730.1 radical SAM protein [Polyangiaceae bacterium]MCB9607341.1 radical SAM protein [Polyangiaceae bacterium]